MNVSLYQAAAALSANSRWQEVISENLASASIPGFKKQELSFESVQAGVQGLGGSSATMYVPQATPQTSFVNGDLKMTGVKTDVAIEGNGFFEVEVPGGGTGYTRDGEFHVNSQGQLVTKSGQLVMSDRGPIQIDMRDSSPISISANGAISQGAQSKGKLKIVEFSDPKLLQPIGGGVFMASNSGVQPTDVAQPSVRQGYLESANTSPTIEMANLITAMRSFETNQRIVQMQDERMSKAISELGNPS